MSIVGGALYLPGASVAIVGFGQTEQDVTEQHFVSILSRLTHHLFKDNGMVKELVSSTALI